jgi:alkanesulfonate monooxygenase SsuD/methylene tetrahydromethanopterin reductase-like flavin-dependent oxidoreductase (luciferase family)
VLGQTTRLEVGTAAAILSNRHPVALAEEAALLDAVSGGRFRLGVGRGGPWVDLEVFGSGLDRFTNGFAESLDLLLATLSGEATVRADGRFFRFREVPVVPRPSRSLPVWAAATSAATVDLAARRGLPLLLGMHDDDAAKAALLDRYTRTAAAAAGREPADAAHPSAHPAHASAHLAHASAHLAYVADTDSDAEEALRGSLSGWLARTGEYMRLDGQAGRRDLDAYVTHLLAIHPVGAPRRCVERLTASLAATGAKRLLLMVEGAGCPDLTLANIARLGAEVLPALKRSATGAPPPPRWADR